MSDRVRTGEILAGIGAVGLAVLLCFGAWFSYDVVLPGGQYTLSGAVGAKHLGWFALLVTILAAVAGLLALVRILTATTTERVMLQMPVAFTAAFFALIVDAVRMLIFTPGLTIAPQGQLAQNVGTQPIPLDLKVAGGGWLGLLALLLLAAGTWIAMADERRDSPAAKARTEGLLAAVPVRPAPPAVGTPVTAADAPAADALGDPSEPSTPSTGESA